MSEPARHEPIPAGLTVDVICEAGDWPSEPVLRSLVERAVDTATARARPNLAPHPEVAVIFTDDGHIRVLNRRHRDKDRPTNVLSFPAGPPVGGRLGPLLGDIVLAFETVAREAAEQGLDFADHATHLIIHGLLHLLGYDHETEAEAVAMERLEAAIMKDLGLLDPYAA